MTEDYTREIVDRIAINRAIVAINQDVYIDTIYSIEGNIRLIVNTMNNYTNAATLNSIKEMIWGTHDKISRNPLTNYTVPSTEWIGEVNELLDKGKK